MSKGIARYIRYIKRIQAKTVDAVGYGAERIGILRMKGCPASKFGIETVVSPVDFNGNGIDDYSDFVAGARRDAKNHPKYDGSYREEGWPPDDIGVCTDVIWRAFKEAGYDLRAMVDKDVTENTGDYPGVETPDSCIDFRRVVNLRVFFEKFGLTLSLDKDDIDQWQPGDIVVFGPERHIGMVSDKRSRKGVSWIIHNGGQLRREENCLPRAEMKIVGHYRFDASRVPRELLIPWKDSPDRNTLRQDRDTPPSHLKKT